MLIKNKNIRLLFIIAACFLIMPTTTIIAQGGPPPPGDDVPEVSIDNDLLILLISGLLLAKYITKKQKIRPGKDSGKNI
ncbi:hypothetical protein [Flavobacterium piscis]|uniref:Signal peptidase n=1 Tax=Flavobacterium piscis TaxID=1114874 RepID=A0ABU1YDS0_9FLAO|nr:hypothetical protein [Flavobacterium piscis]MDR7212253.1 hypothetical protein [Flavobacterium piscis]